MKKLIAFVVLSAFLATQPVSACDEDCAREKAESKHGVTFPRYLTWKYCDGIAVDFMTSAMRSLDNYRTKHFDTKFKGPLRNIRNYLTQRKDWLQECDDYLSKTKESRVFADDKTTKQIFASIDTVKSEFDALIAGATYSTQQDAKTVMDEKIEGLFEQVDNHKILMHLQGKLVIR